MTEKTVALITGANRGLGLEIARQLGKKGLVVVLGSRDPEKGKAAADTLRKEGIDAHAVALDVANPTDVGNLPGYLEKQFGRLDVLVNNAGVAAWGEEDLKSYRSTFEANVFGVVAVTNAVLPLIQKSSAGRIVNQSSVLGSLASIEKAPEMFGNFVTGPYTASKAALNGFTVALAHRLRGSTIKVNSAHPGWVRTDLGGPDAPMNVEDGAKTAVRLATLGQDGPSGQFFHLEERLPW
jgi:NAD(P)-dependent dehydrogenase (short-subunit alcohol dehydrogenase family)